NLVETEMENRRRRIGIGVRDIGVQLQHVAQLLRAKWLGQHPDQREAALAAKYLCRIQHLGAHAAADEDMRATAALGEQAQHFHAVETRHHQIECDMTGLPAFDKAEELVGIEAGAHGEADALRDLGGNHGDRRIVIQKDRKSTRLNSSHVKTSYAV